VILGLSCTCDVGWMWKREIAAAQMMAEKRLPFNYTRNRRI